MSERRFEGLSSYLLSSVFILLLASPAFAEDVAPRTLLSEGRQAFRRGDYIQAEGYLRGAMYEARQAGAPDEKITLVTRELGLVLLAQGRYSEAEQLLNRAVVGIQSNAAVNQQYLPIILANLGRLYQETEQLKRSETAFRRALQLGRQMLKGDPLVVADLQGMLGVLHFKVGRIKQAESDLRRAL